MANPPPAAWAVDSQTETIGLDASGRPVEGIKVMFHTDKIPAASVFVPRAGYSAATVEAAIKGYLVHLQAVANLGG
jgi:benzoyl-CoA reductase/2-hydroxyglutaryl-CoA dehydratase subunit BcrC/BadD/HgdB